MALQTPDVRIAVDQTDAPWPRHRAELYSWWKLPSGQVVEMRRIVGIHNPEVVVRNVNADGELAAGEYILTLRFIVTHGQKVVKA